jgi:hypothetical protein
MNKAQIVKVIKEAAPIVGVTIPENFEFLPLSDIKTYLADIKEKAKENGLQPNVFINQIKSGDYVANTSNNSSSTESDTQETKGQFRTISTGDEETTETEQSEQSEPIQENRVEEKTEPTTFTPEPIDNDIQAHLKNYVGDGSQPEQSEQPRSLLPKKRRKGKQPKVDASGLITGYIILFLANLVFPPLVEFAFSAISKKKKVSSDDVMLKEDQLEQLRPIADAAADFLQYKVNPVILLSVVMGSMYLNNTLAAIKQK